MVNDSGQALATASSLGSDGGSFTVTRTSAVAQSTPSFTIGGGAGGARGRGQWSRVGIQGFVPGARRADSSEGGAGAATGTDTTFTGRGFTIHFGFSGNSISSNFGNLQSLLNQLNQLEAQLGTREGMFVRQSRVLFRR
jgi:hypothetical protein